jgi:outer membrane receptor protein involved in Fe transport
VKVGDAAQTQIGASLEFKPDRNSFIRARMIHFTDNYSQFQPESVTGVNEGRQSWRIPKYTLFELHASYRMRLEKGNIRVGASVFNLFDVFYISDAQNNDTFTRFTNTQNFDAASAGVFPGLGRRFNVNITFEI